MNHDDQKPARYVRVSTYGKDLGQIEEETVQAAGDGSRVLVSTSEGEGDSGSESDSRSAAIAAWAEALCQDRRLSWRRVGHDVLFSGPPD